MNYHVYPKNDSSTHNLEGIVCVCKPEVQFFENGNMLIIHNSFDGREKVELMLETLKKRIRDDADN